MVKNIVKYGLSIAIAGTFFWLAFKDFKESDFIELGRQLSNIDYRWLALTLILMIASHVLRAWRWGVLLSTVKETMSLKNLFNATMIGYAVNMVLPRVGEITKSVNLAKQETIDGKKVLASVVVERILDTLMFALLLAASVFVFRVKINQAFGDVKLWGLTLSFEIAAYLILLASLVILLVFTVISLYPAAVARLAQMLIHRVSKKWAERISSALESFLEGTAALKNRTKYAEIVVSSWAIWGLYLLGTLTPFYAMGLNNAHVFGAPEALTTMSISGFGQLITPAGAGTYQYACTKTLEKIFDIPLIEASGYALLTFALTTVTNAVVGIGCALSQNKDNFFRKPVASSDDLTMKELPQVK